MRRLFGRKPAGRGFSLLEVLIGLVLLAGGIAVMASMFATAILGMAKARNNQIAANAAASLVDRMRQVGINSLNYDNFPATFAVTDPNNPSKQVGTGQLTITPVMDGKAMPVYFVIEVTTTVTGTKGTSARTKLVTYIAPR